MPPPPPPSPPPPRVQEAEKLKQEGNTHFTRREWVAAEKCYSRAIQKHSSQPSLYTNRAQARFEQARWQDVIDDCLRSIEYKPNNMKAYYLIAKTKLEMQQPNEALSSALRAYELCVSSPDQHKSIGMCSQLVIKAKKAKWEVRERLRIRRRKELLAELEDKLKADYKKEVSDIAERLAARNMGEVEAREEIAERKKEWEDKASDLRNAFAISDPEHMEKREVPEWLLDGVTFEIMHDPVVTKNGISYERATLVQHLKRQGLDPLTREPLTVDELRPNKALKEACDSFLNQNSGWVYEW